MTQSDCFYAEVKERIVVQEKIVKRELERLKEYPKLTWKQRYDSILCSMTNDAQSLRRAYPNVRTALEKKKAK